MKAVIQRVILSSVTVDGRTTGEIGHGLNVLVGICREDTDEDIDWLCQKIVRLRIFDDAAGVMNLSVTDIDGEILVISQFTLMASTRKGNRPSWIQAAPPEEAEPVYEKFKERLRFYLGKEIKCGIFGADMKVSILNDGPVTILIDTKQKV